MRTNTRARGARRALAVAAVALVAAACGGGDDDAGGPVTQAPPVSDGGSPDTAAPGTQAPPNTGGPVIETLPPETAPPEAEAVRGGTLRYAIEADVDGLNPTSSQLTAAPGLVMAAAVFDKIAELTADGEAVPYLAESITPNDDFTSWEVTLRPGISFHDGTPLNAEAVRVNFQAQYDDGLVGLAVKPFFPETGAVEVVDDLTVRFNLLEPNAQWPAYMASQLGMVASPAWIAAAIDDPTLNQRPVGTGPFKFDSRSEDSVTRFVRNDGYWNGETYLDAVEFLPVPDSATRAELLITGEIDALHTSEPGAITDLRSASDLTVMLNDSGDETFLMINTEQAPFDDVRVRHALALATPKQQYVDLIGLGVLRQADQMFSPESPYYNPDVRQEADDPESAVPLLAEYCAEHGTETNEVLDPPVPTCTDGRVNIELQWSGPDVVQNRIADLLTEAWRPYFNISHDELLQDAHILQAVTSAYNVVTWRQFGSLNPVTDNVWLMCRTIGGISLNFPRLCDADRDAALLRAQATTDPDERAAAYQEVVQLMHDSYAYIFLTHTMWAHAFGPDVHGVCDRTSPDGVPLACAVTGTSWHTRIWLDQ